MTLLTQLLVAYFICSLIFAILFFNPSEDEKVDVLQESLFKAMLARQIRSITTRADRNEMILFLRARLREAENLCNAPLSWVGNIPQFTIIQSEKIRLAESAARISIALYAMEHGEGDLTPQEFSFLCNEYLAIIKDLRVIPFKDRDISPTKKLKYVIRT